MTNLQAAFKSLRLMGFIARANYLCCQGCAECAIANTVTERIDGGEDQSEIIGSVFYHGQDNEQLQFGNDFYLAFGSVHTDKYGQIGLNTKVVGRIVRETLLAHGVKTEWDGSPSTRIKVKFNSIKKVSNGNTSDRRIHAVSEM